ncbi:MAG TPA: hypothetical protein PKL96_01075 [Bacteroidales bacterium]|nr:hypothetical protein [Bacteroidales bacterium]HPS27881.1 hypothetical protein [Bacteroidales bacterium]
MAVFKKKKIEPPVLVAVPEEINLDEVSAVIAMALDLHLKDIHDYEKTVLTIQKVMRPYSPWSSKFYGLRQTPLHIPRQRLK